MRQLALRRGRCLRSSLVLPATLALAACAGQAPVQTGGVEPLPAFGSGVAPIPVPASAAASPVALLLPLTGAMAPAGQVLANAAKLALPPGASPTLDIRDTASTPAGAASAAQAAIAAGDGLILGPLTSAEGHAVAPIATAAHVNMLAFTNDSGIDAPGVWALGITPAQQVRRVVQAAAGNGATHFAALLPDDVFGHSLGDALNDALTTDAPANATPPSITYYSPGDFSGLNQAVRQLSDFADRGQTLEDQIKAAQDLNTAAGRATALQLQHRPIPPPAFDTLFIGATDGNTLAEIATLLPYYAVNPPQVKLIGPALWASLATAMAGQGVYNGALYAAPDPAAAASFDAKYQTAYGGPPPAIANVAFDAAALAKLAAGEGGYTSAVLTNPSGFTGTNGALLLQPDGQVLRGLAVFQIAPGAPVLASPAPAQVTAPTS